MTETSQNPFSKFTAHAHSVLARSHAIAQSEQAPAVTVRHALAAMAQEKGSMAYNLLKLNDVRATSIAARAQRRSEKEQHAATAHHENPPANTLPYDSVLKNAITKAVATAAFHKHAFVGTEHLLSGILSSSDILASHKRYRKLADQLAHVLEALAQFQKNKHVPAGIFAHTHKTRTARPKPGQRSAVRPQAPATPPRAPYLPVPQKFPTLSFFCEELTGTTAPLDAPATELSHSPATRIPTPFFGREKEMERLMRTLLRHHKSNPLLVGEAGVGKTALVRGFAERIRTGNVPPELMGKRVFALNLGLLVAGTMFRGEFEARIDDIIEEAKHRDVIVFIDELHTVIGTGNASGSLDMANLLKPALASGDIRVIAATTPDEYKKSVARDSALARRFHIIPVREESGERTRAIITATKATYEHHHNVVIEHDAVDAAIALAQRYMPHKRFPDKALDLLDEAAARLKTNTQRSELEHNIAASERELARIEEQKNTAVHTGNYETGNALRDAETAARTRLALFRTAAATRTENRATLSASHIQETVADMLGIAPFDMTAGTADDLVRMLREKIIGQDEAVATIAQVVARGKAGLLPKNRPLGSFLLLGPSGVGKTQTAKELARILFGAAHSEGEYNPFIRIDMSEYAEPHSISRLLGAPPGYVGYEEGGALTEKVKRNPYALVLFDEIEKAHHQIFNTFLQILDEGTLTDSLGERVSFKNTIILFTSNIGTEEFNKHALGFGEGTGTAVPASYDAVRAQTLHILREQLRPELLNRIDHIITFMPLAPDALKSIVTQRRTDLADRLWQEKKIALRFTEDNAAILARIAYNPREGARLVERIVAEQVEYPLAQRILNHTVNSSDTVHVSELFPG